MVATVKTLPARNAPQRPVNWDAETVLSLAQAARSLRPGVHPSTIWRWCKIGTRGGIKLEHFTRGGRRFTSAEALQRFRAACSAEAQPAALDRPTPQIDISHRAEAALQRLKKIARL